MREEIARARSITPFPEESLFSAAPYFIGRLVFFFSRYPPGAHRARVCLCARLVPRLVPRLAPPVNRVAFRRFLPANATRTRLRSTFCCTNSTAIHYMKTPYFGYAPRNARLVARCGRDGSVGQVGGGVSYGLLPECLRGVFLFERSLKRGFLGNFWSSLITRYWRIGCLRSIQLCVV